MRVAADPVEVIDRGRAAVQSNVFWSVHVQVATISTLDQTDRGSTRAQELCFRSEN